ncbi:MAG: hypothetical protein U0401_22875 [Anaerolineae bacterium]
MAFVWGGVFSCIGCIISFNLSPANRGRFTYKALISSGQTTPSPTPMPALAPTSTLMLTRTLVFSKSLAPLNPTPTYARVMARQLHEIPVDYLKRVDEQTIRYAECPRCDELSSLPHKLPWFELILPNGKPQSIPYPHTEMIVPILRRKLGLNPDDAFNNFRISPSGSRIIFFKFPDEESPLYLWQADAKGDNVKKIDRYPGYLDDVEWSKDENVVLLAGMLGEGGGLRLDIHLIDLDQNTIFYLNSVIEKALDNKATPRPFLPRPSLSPDKVYVAGTILPPDFDVPSPSVDELVIFNTQTRQFSDYRLELALASPQWSEDGQSLYLLGRQGELYQFNIAHETVTLLARIENQVDPHTYILPDGFATTAPFQWLIFPEQQRLVIGSQKGLWLIEYSQ